MTATRFPLAWPEGWPRTPPAQRGRGERFKTMENRFTDSGSGYWRAARPVSLEVARKKLFEELARLGAGAIVLSTNIPLRNDGMPRADAARARIDDPGVAIYFTHRKKQMAMACDSYDSPAANIRSLGLAIEAMRQLERHGGGVMMERAFAGFAALPPPRSCWEVLGLTPGAVRAEIDTAFRRLARERHPDRGGSDAAMAELNKARDDALRSLAA